MVYTKDNIGLNIDTVCFYRVVDPVKAKFKVNDIVGSISQITYVTLRIVCGEYVSSILGRHFRTCWRRGRGSMNRFRTL